MPQAAGKNRANNGARRVLQPLAIIAMAAQRPESGGEEREPVINISPRIVVRFRP